MKTWTKDELEKIEMTDELQLASMRNDGKLGKPVTIWVVRIAGNLYVRSVNGRQGKWFQGTQERHEGHIQCGEVDKDVTFVDEMDGRIIDLVDAAYRAKYREYDAVYVDPMLVPDAREATIKLVPH